MYYPIIPHAYIYNGICLTWRDVLWGYERRLVGWDFVVGMASFRVSSGSIDSCELNLILLGKDDVQEIEENLHDLVKKEGSHGGEPKKWLFIALKWLFENRNNISDPLGAVELLYGDFDYPPEIESFVRYMPPSDGYKPKEHTAQQNLDRIFLNWSKFIKSMDGFCQGGH